MPREEDAVPPWRGESGEAARDRRDHPVEQEGDKDIKKGGIERSGGRRPSPGRRGASG
jgi:hypothetical protein